MKGSLETNRRAFLQCTGLAWWTMGSRDSANEMQAGSCYARGVQADGRECIDVFRKNGEHRELVQQVSSEAPVSLAVHPNLALLYAANNVAVHEGLPQGTVEVFSIEKKSGKLSRLQRQRLSLSATEPRTIAIAPNGRNLVVAAYGGGIYNVLPIRQDGSLGPATGIFKELGCGAHPEHQASAHPHTVLFDQSGRFVLASDFGCDQLSVFVLGDEGELERRSRVSLGPGAGPGEMVLQPAGSWLYVRHELARVISCHRYNAKDGIIEAGVQHVRVMPKRLPVQA